MHERESQQGDASAFRATLGSGTALLQVEIPCRLLRQAEPDSGPSWGWRSCEQMQENVALFDHEHIVHT